MKRNRWTVQGYLTALEKDKQNLTDHMSLELQDNRNSVVRTWKLSFDQILTQGPQAAKLLHFGDTESTANSREHLITVCRERCEL